MKIRILTTAAAGVLAMSLAACVSAKDVTSLVKAANELDPDCGKDTHVWTMLFATPWGVYPLPMIDHRKVCHPELLPGGQAPPVQTGTIIGAPAAPLRPG